MINRRSRRPEKTPTTGGHVQPKPPRGAIRPRSTLGPGTRWDGAADHRHRPRTVAPIPPSPVLRQAVATKCERWSATPGRVLTNEDGLQRGTPATKARPCLGGTRDPDGESCLRSGLGTPDRRVRAYAIHRASEDGSDRGQQSAAGAIGPVAPPAALRQ